jgi:hypothetical protein
VELFLNLTFFLMPLFGGFWTWDLERSSVGLQYSGKLMDRGAWEFRELSDEWTISWFFGFGSWMDFSAVKPHKEVCRDIRDDFRAIREPSGISLFLRIWPIF